MSALLFDTLKFTDVLEATFTREQARNLTQAFVEATGDQIVTKSDMLLLEQKLQSRFDKIDVRFDKIDARVDRVDARFDQVDARFDQVDARFNQVDARFDQVDARFDRVQSTLRGEISMVRVDTVRWIVAAIVLNFGGIAALIFTAVKVFGK